MPNRNIIVNGRSKSIAASSLSYADILNLAYDGSPPWGDQTVATVAYHRGPRNATGTLIAGQSVQVKGGMVFDVAVTDRA